jgi:hypothetical protein
MSPAAIPWLPDIPGWACIVAHFLEQGGSLYPAEGHPAVLVLDDAAYQADGHPGLFAALFPYTTPPWQMFKCLTRGPDGQYRWPDKLWLPLAYSLQATKPLSSA